MAYASKCVRAYAKYLPALIKFELSVISYRLWGRRHIRLFSLVFG